MRDDELVDQALSRIHRDTPAMSEEAYRAGLAKVLTATREQPPAEEVAVLVLRPMDATPRPKRRAGWIAGAVAASVLLAVALAMPQLWSGGNSTNAASPADALEGLADASGDPSIRPGQYLYVRTKTSVRTNTGTKFGKPCKVLSDETIDLWVPADASADWLQRTQPGGEARYEGCTESDMHDHIDKVRHEPERRARDGRFTTHLEDGRALEDQGPPSVFRPTPAFLAGLPRDPQALRAYLSSVSYPGDWAVFEHVATLLSSGIVPADLRAASYRTLALLTEVRSVEGVTTTDGRTGTAIRSAGVMQPDSKTLSNGELIIDPANGIPMQVQLGAGAQERVGEILWNNSATKSLTLGVAGQEGAPPGQ